MKDRNIFISKVFTIVSGQLLAAFGMSCIPLLIPSVQTALYGNPYAVSVALFCCICNLCALYYNKKKSPINVILLSTLTLFDGYLIGMVIGSYHPIIVAKGLLCTGERVHRRDGVCLREQRIRLFLDAGMDHRRCLEHPGGHGDAVCIPPRYGPQHDHIIQRIRALWFDSDVRHVVYMQGAPDG